LKWERRLNLLSRDSKLARRSVVVAFEGPDAAGKGGAIRRVTGALDVRRYEVVPIGAPSENERAFPYLWRFWRHVPRPGRFTLFDRSWYGRVLVERVEELCPPEAWTRAYSEICDFEAQLHDKGVIVVKVWLAISKEEQLARFRAREEADWKRFKITPEDWRNRHKWAAYEVAANDMVARTSTPEAPWTLIAANNKDHARITVLETVTRRIEEAL
jgi:polyphosphate kinase 2 (PPK2 family)